jgi:hypothetical protein
MTYQLSTENEPGSVIAPMSHWTWPDDDHQVVSFDSYYLSSYSKQGLSTVKTARSMDDSSEAWRNRKRLPIQYLVKFGHHAVAERLYYRLARLFDLPQQHVYWGTRSGEPAVVAVAIQFEPAAFFPKAIDVGAGTVTYRRRTIPVPNATEYGYHRALHTFCGSHDGNQVMVKDGRIFGIDAADCRPSAANTDAWRYFLDWYAERQPDMVPSIIAMLKRIARRDDIPAIVEAELKTAPSLRVRDVLPGYCRALQETHAALCAVLVAKSLSDV